MCFELVENLAMVRVFVEHRAEMKGTLCAASLQELMIDQGIREGYSTVYRKRRGKADTCMEPIPVGLVAC